MISISPRRLKDLFEKFTKQKIAVIGDLMLDRYIWGNIVRISPEAPVPVLDVDSQSESFRFGGAANVTLNVKTLGADVVPVGVIGLDESGLLIKKLCKEHAFSTEGLVVDKERPTTVKTRIIAHNQHIIRIDREVKTSISKKITKRIYHFLEQIVPEIDGIILEDYNKGLLIPEFIQDVIQLANKNKKMVFVDPKFDHFFNYQGVTLFKPNRKEVSDKLGYRLDSDGALEMAGNELLRRIDCRAILVTMGEAGMALFESGKPFVKMPTRAVKVHDVSGAGDTVIACMAVSMAAGSSLKEAATIANHAAGLVCGEVGIVPVDREWLYQTLLLNNNQ